MIRVCLIGLSKPGSKVARVCLNNKIKLVAPYAGGEAQRKERILEVIGCRDTGIIVNGPTSLRMVSAAGYSGDFSKPEATIRNCYPV